MNGRKRTVQIKFRVTEEERAFIEQKMQLVPTRNMEAYLRKMAIDGYIIQIDHADIKAMTAEIQKIGVNVNQIAKRVNATGSVYQEDIEEIKEVLEELLARLQAEGFTIKRGKYVSCLVPGQERFTRLKTLGADYTEEAIRERIEGKRTRTAKAPKTERGVSLLIDIENSIKAAQSRGYEQWAKIHNLKQAAKTMNFITEHKIEQYTDLTAKIAEIQTESEQAADALKSAEKRLVDMAVLIKNVSTFQKTKPAYDAYRKARNKDSYRAAHEREIILHEAAAKALKAAGVSKLPNLTALQSEYEKLQEQKEALYADYGRLKKQVKEYDVIKQNIDSILRQPREPEREKGKERGE